MIVYTDNKTSLLEMKQLCCMSLAYNEYELSKLVSSIKTQILGHSFLKLKIDRLINVTIIEVYRKSLHLPREQLRLL